MEEHKISFVLMKGHGSQYTFSLGDFLQASHEISASDVSLGEGIARMRKFLAEKSTVIVDSCNTGESGGFAQSIFEHLGVRVIATDHTTSGINSINVKIRKEGVDFKVEFNISTDPIHVPLLGGFGKGRKRKIGAIDYK